MANDTSRRPWALDTAAVITADRVRIRSLYWTGGGAADNCQVEDANGERIWDGLAREANHSPESFWGDKGRDFQGFELAVIDAGILYVDYV